MLNYSFNHKLCDEIKVTVDAEPWNVDVDARVKQHKLLAFYFPLQCNSWFWRCFLFPRCFNIPFLPTLWLLSPQKLPSAVPDPVSKAGVLK